VKLALVVPGGVDRSGTDRVVPALLWLIERLARRHEVHVFALDQEPVPAQWELLGARVSSIGSAPGRRRRFFAAVAGEHRARRFDVIHAFWGGCGTLAAFAGWRHRVPMMLHLGGGELVALPDIGYGGRLTLRGRLGLRVATAGARRVTVASLFMQRLAAMQGVAAQQVPLGVALDRWPVRSPRPRDGSRPARLLSVGDIRPVKDQSTLLNAASRLAASGVRFDLDIAGLDTMDGAAQALARAVGVGALVRWHGLLAREALRALVEEADLLLVSSRHEAGPLAMLEAAIAGVPTVGTAVGHVADWSPEAAVAVPPGDGVALADAAQALLAEEERRLALAREAQRRAIAWDADFTATSFERIYDELVDDRPSR
jgi:glycosyltransferase involved in cell wall biosynthesis